MTNHTIHPKSTDLALDVMRRKAQVQTRIFAIIDPLPISERIAILEELLDALDEADPSNVTDDSEQGRSVESQS